MKKTYGNIAFVARKGKGFRTKFRATVEETTITGILWWKKEITITREIQGGGGGAFWRFCDTGALVDYTIARMLVAVFNMDENNPDKIEE